MLLPIRVTNLVMSFHSPTPVFIALVMILAMIVLLWTGQIGAKRRVTRWCEREGYQLVTWRGAWFYEGPRAWCRTEEEDAYRIEVRDRKGQTRSGYVVFGTWWNPFSRKVRVEWD
jgi:hypothetical protein